MAPAHIPVFVSQKPSIKKTGEFGLQFILKLKLSVDTGVNGWIAVQGKGNRILPDPHASCLVQNDTGGG